MKLSQEALAELCTVTRQTINAIENEKYDPSLSLAFNLARELGTTVDNLFTPKQEGLAVEAAELIEGMPV